MSIGTAAGCDILEAHVLMPPRGAWTADLVLDTEAGPSIDAPIAINLSSLTLSGTVVSGGATNRLTTLRVIGGGGGINTKLSPKDYRGVPARVPLIDALEAAGEKLSDSCDESLLAIEIPRWVTFAESMAAFLDEMADHLKATWRMLADGTVWIGVDTFPAVKLEYEMLKNTPHLGVMEIGVESPTLVPGVNFMGQNVSQVEHVIAEGAIRTVVTFA